MSLKTVSIVAAVLLLFTAIGIAPAQERKADPKVDRDRGTAAPLVDPDSARDKTTDKGNKASQGMSHRASEIQGMTVANEAGEQLGSVSDCVIDVRLGQVEYAALSYGGFLGIGDKLFAVPWDAFKHRHDAESDEHTLVLNVDAETLKSAPGFDQSSWPNFADPTFRDEVKKHYRRGVDVDVSAGKGKVDVDVDVTRDADRADRRQAVTEKDAEAAADRDAAVAKAKDVIHRTSAKIMGMTVKDAAGKDVGSVNDLVVDMDTGKVRYAALSYGGFLGLGDKLFAVPWSSFECNYDASEDAHYLVLAVDEATLRKAPGFDQNNWPNLADPKFGDDIDQYYDGNRRSEPAERIDTDTINR